MENAYGISPLTFNFIKQREGYAPRPKWDYRQYSVGYGTKWNPGQPIGGKAEHESALAREIGNVDGWLNRNVTVPLDDSKRAALTSFGFNLGVDDLERLKGDINAGNWQSVAHRMPSFNKAGGEVNEGLVNRRAQEVALLNGQNPDANMNSPYQTERLIDPRSPYAPAARPVIGGNVAGGVPAATQPMAGVPSLAQALRPPSERDKDLATAYQASAIKSQPKNWGELILALSHMASGAGYAQRHDEAEKSYRSKLAEALTGAKGTDEMVTTLLGSGDPDLQKAGLQLKISQTPKPQQPLRGKERYLATPAGVMDVETQQIIPGTERTAAADKPPAGYRPTQDGNLAFIPGGPADPATNNKQVKYNEGQTKSANFGHMMTEAEKLVGDQANPTGFWGQLREDWAPESVNNQMRSEDQQKYRQAASQWIRAKLRKESGAAIGRDEMEREFETFFPQAGDGPEVVAQKKAARLQATQGMLAESGGAYDSLFPKAGPGPGPAPVAGAAPPQAQPSVPQAGVPTAGEIQDGYRFKGGNPADQSNWEKVQ